MRAANTNVARMATLSLKATQFWPRRLQRPARTAARGLPLLLEQIVDETLDVVLDRISGRAVSLVFGYVVPRIGLTRRDRIRGQRAANREDHRRRVDVSLSDGRRLAIGRRQTVLAETLQRAHGEVGLRIPPAIDGARAEPLLGGDLVEIGGRNDALGRAVFAHEHDRGFSRQRRLRRREYAQDDQCQRNHAAPSCLSWCDYSNLNASIG